MSLASRFGRVLWGTPAETARGRYMSVEIVTQITTSQAAELVDEQPFYIPMTGPAARPRRSLKHDDTFVVLDSHGDIGASAGGPDGLLMPTPAISPGSNWCWTTRSRCCSDRTCATTIRRSPLISPIPTYIAAAGSCCRRT